MFYVSGRGWVAAGDLNDGDEVYLIDGSVAYVTGAELEQLAEPIKVYNLEVEGLNTYFVGDEAVLVHNYGPNGSKKYTPYDSTDMEKQWHHIATNKNDYYTPDFEAIASKYNLNLDDDWNKIYIEHQGTHPWEYHDFILERMDDADLKANGNVDIFVSLWRQLGELLQFNPEMLYTEFWRKP